MIDIHTHILPHMDDGSSSRKMSIEMLKMLKAQGVTEVALTSHFYPEKESLDSFIMRREASYEMLLNALPDELSDIKLYLGAEIAYFDGIEKTEGLERLKISELNILLVEMPFQKWTERMLTSVIEMNNVLGIDVLLAHIERYLSLGNYKNILFLQENGIKLQTNSSILNKPILRQIIFNLYKKGKIDYLGSDCHNLTKRKPEIKKCAEKLISLK